MLLGKRYRIPVLVESAVGVLLVLVLAGPAGAQQPEERDSVSGHTVDGLVKIRVGSERRAVEKGATEGVADDGCTWSIYVADDLSQPIFENGVGTWDDLSPLFVPDQAYDSARLFSGTGRWFSAAGCGNGFEFRNGIYAEGDSISIPELVGEAVRRLDPPGPTSIGTSPEDDGDGRFAVVHIPTWFWIEDGYWNTIWTERASFPPDAPRIWADAFADPATTEWSPGDGTSRLSCPGQGTIWLQGMSEDATNCAHTYTWPSVDEPDLAYTVDARVWFDTWWESNVAGQPGGPLAPISRDSPPQSLRVGEIQAVES